MTDHFSDPSPAAVRLDHYTPADQSEILGDGADPFGVADAGMTWLPKEIHFGVRHEGRLVAHTGLLRLSLSAGGIDTAAVGVGGVAVAPELRGHGLARVVVGAALEHARTMGPPYGILFCRPPLVPLYGRLGWQELDQEVHVEQPQGTVTMPLRTMWTPLHDGAQWPSGEVRLHSFPM
ncbi:GNAT family N-acetyltransferase [Streptomyces sp. NBC_01465]|uniref:GNAT family N-acetyltransferase n=1 Tax=Streptomyces sp. NBC_01465 TaxID=2903878 RepID=UPI002E36BB9C|nr:GNAT family N-acetyltransferase [Streptomyces sp. NBC_01465]